MFALTEPCEVKDMPTPKIYFAYLAEDAYSERVQFTSYEDMMEWVNTRGKDNCVFGEEVFTYYPEDDWY